MLHAAGKRQMHFRSRTQNCSDKQREKQIHRTRRHWPLTKRSLRCESIYERRAWNCWRATSAHEAEAVSFTRKNREGQRRRKQSHGRKKAGHRRRRKRGKRKRIAVANAHNLSFPRRSTPSVPFLLRSSSPSLSFRSPAWLLSSLSLTSNPQERHASRSRASGDS